MIGSFLGKQAFANILRHLDGRIDMGRLTLTLPDGSRHVIEGANLGPEASLTIHSYRFMWRILRHGSVGFAEAYMEQDCDTPDMRAVMGFVVANARWFDSGAFSSQGIANVFARLRHGRRDNTQAGSKKNISYHYDLGNDFYAQWLDPSMTYSSAVFGGKTSLAHAQEEKYDRLAKLINLKPGMHILEVGCGWGGFAEFAARKYGAQITGLTISKEQHTYGQARIEKAGLSKAVDLQFCDYRDHVGRDYDGVISIEMFEAVGENHWQTYFEQLRAFLRPGGKAALQIITIAEEHYAAYRASPDFIQKYIFPGGMLPTPTHLQNLADGANIRLDTMDAYGKDYAKTLDMWLENFRAAWPHIAKIGFDERFKRMWEYYLLYCAAGFMDGRIDVKQVAFTRP